MNSDEVLMHEFQQGSRAAFEELYARYSGPLYGFFRRRLESPQRAEDLAQETFLAVIRGARRYEPRALVRTYLYGIALKMLASERRKQRGSVDSPDRAPEPSAPSTQESLFLISDGPMLVVWTLILFLPARWAWRRYRKYRETPSL